jgi:acetyl-CoA synthetase
MSETGPTLSNLSTESRSFPPSAQFTAQANAGPDLYTEAEKIPSGPSRPSG